MNKNIKRCFEDKFQLVENSTCEGKKYKTAISYFWFSDLQVKVLFIWNNHAKPLENHAEEVTHQNVLS